MAARRADEATTFANRFWREFSVDHDESKAAVILHRARRARTVGSVDQIRPGDVSFQHVAIGVDNAHRRTPRRFDFTSSVSETGNLAQGIAEVHSKSAPVV